MNNLINLKQLPMKIYSKTLRKLYSITCKTYATQTSIKIQKPEDAHKELMKDFETLSNITMKVKTKKPQKPPFIKNLFLGIYDTDILTYPQLEKEQLEQLDKQIQPVKSYFKDLPPEQKPLNLASDFVENLKRLKVFGLQGPQLLDARELNITESCRFYDILGSSTSTVTGLLSNELFGIQVLVKVGSDEQKKKYLPQLIRGDVVVAFCMFESDNMELTQLKTNATLTNDKKSWILNGEKSSVINGNIADLLVVIARTEKLNDLGIKERKLSAFLVEKAFGGITSDFCDKLMGIDGTDIANLKFDKTSVPAENVLGETNEGESLIESLITEFRLSTGPACSAIMRKLMDNLVPYSTHMNSGGASIAETDYVRCAIAEIAISLYAVESMTYLTAGLMDQYENQDCQAESAIVKVFSAEQACASTLKCMGLIGASAYTKNHWCNILHRDALSHLILHENSDSLKITIALLGLQHAGLKIQDTIKIVRNPLFHPGEILKRMWTQRRQQEDNPTLTLSLGDYLHPSATLTAQYLEYCVLRLQFATETLLARYGPEVINKHMELNRLAECVMEIYAMTATLGRASRAYCIGLRNADYEMLLANAYCLDAMERVKYKINKICSGPYATNDENYRKIGKKVFTVGKYFAEHPLTRNF